MEFRETVTFNPIEQSILKKVISCIHIVESQIKAVDRLLCGQVTRGNLLESRDVLEQVLPVLRARTRYQADPKWVQQVKEAEARGLFPLITDPEAMCRTIRESAEMQIEYINQAIALIDLTTENLRDDWTMFEEEETIWSELEAETKNASLRQ
jgi:hypothetical protein